MTKQTAQPEPRNIFISAAEHSGDQHAARLIQQFTKIAPGSTFVGVAGPNMQLAGCKPIADMTAKAAMLTGALGNIASATRILTKTSHEFSHHHYDACVLVDSPMLNLPIALRAKMRNITTFYYIAPQLWAWAEYRVHKVKSRIDKLAVILPFEQEFFRSHGLNATYVGHPLFDRLRERPADPAISATIKTKGQPTIAILPGSRKHVIKDVLPGQLQVATAIQQRFPGAHLGVSAATESCRELIQQVIQRSGTTAETYINQNAELLSAADLTLVASGTATLEVAHYGSPMIVMYNGSKLMYHLLGRWLINIPHLSLINILAKRELVPEFMPYYNTVQPIAQQACDILANPQKAATMRQALATTIAPLSTNNASQKAATLLHDTILHHTH
jgi:lipid-A-disaccharide synthase